jgi:transcriptional regulator with XRE-family HTH domain
MIACPGAAHRHVHGPRCVARGKLASVPDRATNALGEIIRQQRELAELSMRQFAELAGISNPYLSQIERGLRAPSEQVVEAIARSLKVSVDTLYERAGVAPRGTEDEDGRAVLEAIAADSRLTARQRSALREVYEAFVATSPRTGSWRGEHRAQGAAPTGAETDPGGGAPPAADPDA